MIIYKLLYFSLVIFSILSCDINTELKSNNLEIEKRDKIDSLANRYLELNRFSGVVIIAHADSIIYNKSFGFANYDEEKSFSNKTSFKIGEISKIITEDIISADGQKK